MCVARLAFKSAVFGNDVVIHSGKVERDLIFKVCRVVQKRVSRVISAIVNIIIGCPSNFTPCQDIKCIHRVVWPGQYRAFRLPRQNNSDLIAAWPLPVIVVGGDSVGVSLTCGTALRVRVKQVRRGDDFVEAAAVDVHLDLVAKPRTSCPVRRCPRQTRFIAPQRGLHVQHGSNRRRRDRQAATLPNSVYCEKHVKLGCLGSSKYRLRV